MKLHPRELALARAHAGQQDFEALTTNQVHLVMERGRALYKWFKSHPGTHNLINGLVVLSIFAVDGWVLIGLPALFLAAGRRESDVVDPAGQLRRRQRPQLAVVLVDCLLAS